METAPVVASSLATADLRALSRQVYAVNLLPLLDRYAEVVSRVRDLGVSFSDRRAVKTLKLVAASAVLCGRDTAGPSDLWPLRYAWDREEQAAPLRALVDGILASAEQETAAHPLAIPHGPVDPEIIARGLDDAERELAQTALGLAAIARIRERLADLSDRAAWVSAVSARTHLRHRVDQLLTRLDGTRAL
jgi:MoxR-like ATPase